MSDTVAAPQRVLIARAEEAELLIPAVEAGRDSLEECTPLWDLMDWEVRVLGDYAREMRELAETIGRVDADYESEVKKIGHEKTALAMMAAPMEVGR